MSPGTSDLIILIFVFIVLQALWLVPLIKNNKKLNYRNKELIEEIEQLEKLYKK